MKLFSNSKMDSVYYDNTYADEREIVKLKLEIMALLYRIKMIEGQLFIKVKKKAKGIISQNVQKETEEQIYTCSLKVKFSTDIGSKKDIKGFGEFIWPNKTLQRTRRDCAAEFYVIFMMTNKIKEETHGVHR